MKRIVLIGMSVAVMSVQAGAHTSEADGDWSNPDTWDGSSYPQGDDDANISHYVTLSQDEAAANVHLAGASLDANANTLTIGTNLTLTGGELLDGTYTAETLDWSAGTIRQSTVSFSGGSLTPSSTVYLDVVTLNASGAVSQSGTGSISLYASSSTINSSGVWSYGQDGVPFSYYGTFRNLGGTFRKSAGSGTTTVSVPFEDHAGTLGVSSGTLQFSGAVDLSNTTFSAASGARISIVNGGYLRGTMSGSGGGTLGFAGGNFYPTDVFSLDLGSGTMDWSGGQFRDGDVETLSPVTVSGSAAHYLISGDWTAAGGVDHAGTGGFLLQNAALTIPEGASYMLRQDGTLLSNLAGSSFLVDGTLEKMAGSGTTTVSVPVYGNAPVINVSTGTLALTGGGVVGNQLSTLADGSVLTRSGTLSNAVITATGQATFYPASSDSTVCGDLMLTNIAVRLTGPKLFASPYLALVGSGSSFEFSSGQIRDGVLANVVPMTISGGGAHYFSYCDVYSYADTDFDAAGTYFQYSDWHVGPGVTNRINAEGEFLGGIVSASYSNWGTLHKTGEGTSGSSVPFYDERGTIRVDDGILWLTSASSVFDETRVDLASGAAFWMSGSATSNMMVQASGPASLRLAVNYDQAVQTDLVLLGPVTAELADGDLTMNGAFVGVGGSFSMWGGKIENSHLTNSFPTRFRGSDQAWVVDSDVVLQDTTTHTNLCLWLQRSRLIVADGVEYQLESDGTLFSNSSAGTLENRGCIIKTGGDGLTESTAIFENAGGVVGARCGTLKLYSDLDLTGGGLSIQLGGTNDFGKVQSTGAVTVDGGLDVDLRDSYEPAAGASFQILSATSLTGSFSATNLPALDDGLVWTVEVSGSVVTLAVVGSGDTDNDAMDDGWESDHGLNVGVDDSAGNPDEDLFDNLSEYIADTDPNDSNDWFRVVAVGDGTVVFNSSSNRLYSLITSSNLVDGLWVTNETRMGVGGADSMCGTTNAPQEFYRLDVALP